MVDKYTAYPFPNYLVNEYNLTVMTDERLQSWL